MKLTEVNLDKLMIELEDKWADEDNGYSLLPKNSDCLNLQHCDGCTINYYELNDDEERKSIFYEERPFHPYVEFKRVQVELLRMRRDLMKIIYTIGRIVFWEE